EFGDGRELNAWGGQSRATTRVLEMLHYRGFLRVARRQAGIRVYEAAPVPRELLAPEERIRRLALLTARLFTPLPEASLRAILSHLRHSAPALTERRTIVSRLLTTGDLERGDVDGVAYVWTQGMGPVAKTDVPRTVRFLAPFDPVVWDRRRFEHLWGWPYRFEAYTPAARRQFGYYALPLLWADRVIGWANVSAAGGQLDVELGFINQRPRDRAFTRALDAEVERMRRFLGLAAGPVLARPVERSACAPAI
ncbi:MAG: DNA glycosylase AlkZ-like family protein, partial [Gemmatimonadaceae bacterium]